MMRKLALFAFVFLVTASGGGDPASAVTLKREALGVTCSAVTQPTHTTSTSTGSGGCLVRFTATGVEYSGSFGSVVCHFVFEGRLDGTGVGYIYNPLMHDCSPVQLSPCSEPAGSDPGPLRITSESSVELGAICFGSFLTGTLTCHLVAMNLKESLTHRYTVSTTPTQSNGHQLCEGGQLSFEGVWTQTVDAAHPAIEIVD
jgi:hypothetical protein